MTSQYTRVLVPPTVAAPRAAAWAGDIAVMLGTAFDWAGRSAKRLWGDDAEQPDSARDLLTLASRVEREMPNLATELRAIAMHRPRLS